MTRRYFSSTLPVAGGIISIEGTEAHHAINVMRIRSGEEVTLFDGLGNQASAVVHTVDRKAVIFDSSPTEHIDRENKVRLTLGVAMPKGDRGKELVERLTELGVNELVPLHCQRTQWPVETNAIQKWQRVILDACKQSGRNELMTIGLPVPLKSWLSTDNKVTRIARYLVHPGTTPRFVPSQTSLDVSEYAAAIGPEGGFSDDEVAVADAFGWGRLDLGNRIYRIETAAVIAAVKLAII